MEFKTLRIVQKDPSLGVFHLLLNNPSRKNALTMDFFDEYPRALSSLDQNPSARVVILSSDSDHFCSGIDISALSTITPNPQAAGEQGRTREAMRRMIKQMQAAVSAAESCRKPVIAAVDGGCIGGGIDLITACDLRVSTEGAFFSVKEVDLALAADLGTLQRLPALVGFGNAADLALTGRRFSGGEAKALGLVQRVFPSRTAMEDGVWKMAVDIAEKSPLAVMGTKAVLLRSRELTVEQGLDYVATWNSAMLPSDDLKEAIEAYVHKRKPVFAKL
ncbi:delta(3,5)-Delta(2,4)-dienoyl-CoA isomerase, peroxisomal [Nymphaea colorata]|nr:delta(3,5)-Delta(2,4)-dienoyl-CoA isomerase, peroxisomal [Nymphaea colorata]